MLDRFKSLIAGYAALPGELRSIAAMLIIAVPLALLAGGFFVFRDMFGLSSPAAILLVVGVLVGLVLLVLLILGIRLWIVNARRNRMGRMLATAGATGPTAMGGADIRQMNEKFRRSVDEMRKHGYRVYDMPWYIVVGDSGCGKTKLVNESGLQFPLGRPEEITGDGITVGTKDYNWWFTENMIFIDMAGKLVNPQEESGHQTWLGMLKIIARGRPAVPINGAIVCVSVEDLVGKSEKRRRDAENMQLRLRELQMHLGVTFPTYVVVTKCDLIPGFLEFFRKVGRDLLLRNQIAGWSRPGAFSAAYDADSFPADFEDLCRRMHALRLKRLGDDEDELLRENAYCFPEHFRQLAGPVHEYIATVFPQLKNTRGVSQLLFRGVYFTSATQDDRLLSSEGGLGEVLQGLKNLYEKPEPHFLKDLLLKKLCPEQGLVYRNEAQLKRNKRLALALAVSSVLLAVFGTWAGIASYGAFARLIANPSAHARGAHFTTAKDWSNDDALVRAAELTRDISSLQQNSWAARLLSTFIDPGKPVRNLQRILAGVFETKLLPLTKNEAQTALATPPRGARESVPPDKTSERRFLDAARAFLKWNALAGQSGVPSCLTAAELIDLARYTRAPDASGTLADWSSAGSAARAGAAPASAPSSAPAEAGPGENITFEAIANAYMSAAGESAVGAKNPAAAFDGAGSENVWNALEAFLTQRARLDWAENEDSGRSGKYVALASICRGIAEQYDDLLEHLARAGSTAKLAEAEQFGTDLAGRAQRFREQATLLDSPSGLPPKVEAAQLWDWLQQYKQSGWDEPLSALEISLQRCSAQSPAKLAAIRSKLDHTYAEALFSLGFARSAADVESPAGAGATRKAPDGFLGIPGRYKHIVRRLENDTYAKHDDLPKVVTRVAALGAAIGGLKSGSDWTLDASRKLFDELKTRLLKKYDVPLTEKLDVVSEWNPGGLVERSKTALQLGDRVHATVQVRTISNELSGRHTWGVAELFANWNDAVASDFSIELPAASSRPTVAANQPTSAPSGAIEIGSAVSRPAATQGVARIPRAATAEFLTTAAITTGLLLEYLGQPDIQALLFDEGAARPASEALVAGWNAYVTKNFSAWRTAVKDATYANVDPRGQKDAFDGAVQENGRKVEEFMRNVSRAGHVEGRGWLREIPIQDSNPPKYPFARLHDSLDERLTNEFNDFALKPASIRERRDCDKVYAESWRKTREDTLTLRDALGGAIIAGRLDTENSFKRFELMEFPWRDFPPIRAARGTEDALCAEYRAEIDRRIANANRQRVKAICKLRVDLGRLGPVLAACSTPAPGALDFNDPSWSEICEFHESLLKYAKVTVDVLSSDKLNELLGVQTGDDIRNAQDLYENASIVVGQQRQSWSTTTGKYPALPVQDLASIGHLELVFATPINAAAAPPAPIAEDFEDPAETLVLFMARDTRQLANYTFVTVVPFTTQQATGGVNKTVKFRIGLGWVVSGVNRADIIRYVDKIK